MSLYNIVSPSSLVPGQPEDVSQVLANFQAIQAILNGGIDDVNIRSTAAIAASKLAGYPADATMKLQGDGTWTRLAPTIQVITAAGAGTYTRPAGVKAILVECVAGGGGGGGVNGVASGQFSAGGGGGGGGYAALLIAGPAATYPYVVGAGGASVTAGGNTTFGTGPLVQANGGNPGIQGLAGNTPAVYPGGNGGGGVTGTILRYGTAGVGGMVFAAFQTLGGSGGASGIGGGGTLGNVNGAGNTAAPGGGGGGGAGIQAGASTALLGGAGGVGVIIVTEFY